MRAVGTVTLAGVHPGVVAKIKSAFATNNWPIYIWGLPGRGKSGAAKVVYEDMVGSRVWWRAADLCTDIAAIRMGGSLTRSRGDLVWQETERSIWNKLDAARFAVIDDLGTRDPSGASYDVLLSATDYRARKPTIWTGNLSPVDLAKLYDARLVSRICCGVVIEIRGPDRRLATAETCVFG